MPPYSARTSIRHSALLVLWKLAMSESIVRRHLTLMSCRLEDTSLRASDAQRDQTQFFLGWRKSQYTLDRSQHLNVSLERYIEQVMQCCDGSLSLLLRTSAALSKLERRMAAKRLVPWLHDHSEMPASFCSHGHWRLLP